MAWTVGGGEMISRSSGLLIVAFLGLVFILASSCPTGDVAERAAATHDVELQERDRSEFERFLNRPLLVQWAATGTSLEENLYWAPTEITLVKEPDDHFPDKFEIEMNADDEESFVYDYWQHVFRNDYTPRVQIVITTGFLGIECFLNVEGERLVGYGQVLSDIKGTGAQLSSVVVSLASSD